MTTAEILNAAADLCERGWTQGDFAVNADGRVSAPWDKSAVAWCVIGAVRSCTKDAWDVTNAIALLHGYVGQNVSAWNDTPGRTQAEVVETLRKAAESA